MMEANQLRIARPTDHLDQLVTMYQAGLDMEVLGVFKDHEGFDGVMLGSPDMPYHLEFTHHREHSVGKAPTQDNLLIFYIPNPSAWGTQCEKMLHAGFLQVPSYNPYWDVQGKTFEDIDAYRIVLQNAAWAS